MLPATLLATELYSSPVFLTVCVQTMPKVFSCSVHMKSGDVEIPSLPQKVAYARKNATWVAYCSSPKHLATCNCMVDKKSLTRRRSNPMQPSCVFHKLARLLCLCASCMRQSIWVIWGNYPPKRTDAAALVETRLLVMNAFEPSSSFKPHLIPSSPL